MIKNDKLKWWTYFIKNHEDEKFKDTLETYLKLAKRQGYISVWHDRKISPGDFWEDEISNQLMRTKIFLLLISIDFLTSEYCVKVEMKAALEQHAREEAIVIPIIVRECDWKDTILGKFQVLPKDGKPISTWESNDAVYVDIMAEIKKRVKSLNLE